MISISQSYGSRPLFLFHPLSFILHPFPILFVALFLIRLPAIAAPPSVESVELFEKSVRPVLIAQCWNCHADTKQESGLRLDSREAILKGGERGASVKSGDGAASLLVHAMRGDDELKMPPIGRLSADQIAAISRWIDLGLPWPADTEGSARTQAWKTHWAFQPVVRPTVPLDAGDQWSSTAIDRFVLNRLMAKSAQPSPLADRRTLIRRASFDLLGLPPTPEQVDDFTNEPAPDAFDRLIDRLLASPLYGERWGRHWLDIARYADNKGYVFFEEASYPWAYVYRDYVIRSFNEDKPYDQFVIEQLAADQLDGNGDTGPLAAMGYLTVGSHFMGNVHDIIDDRIDVVARGLMGLTVTCARCHDHKYDPIPTADYYALYGVFRSSVEPLVPPLVKASPQTPEYYRFTAELSLRQQRLDDFVQQKYSALVDGARTRVAEYLLAAQAAADKPATDDFMLIADANDLNPAMIVRWQAYFEKQGKAEPRFIGAKTGRRQDPNGSGRGRAEKGDLLATESLKSQPGDEQAVSASQHPVWGPWLTLSVVPNDRFAEESSKYCSRLAAGEFRDVSPLIAQTICDSRAPVSLPELAARYGELMKGIHQEWQGLVRDSVILKRPMPIRLADEERELIRQELYGDQAPSNVPRVFGWGFLSLLPDRGSQAEYQKVLKDVEQWIINGPGAPARAMVLLDGELYEPRIFQRGNPSRPGTAVQRRFLTALSNGQPFDRGSGRLDLALAITDRANPLTARVLVNRLWQQHFGGGLVRTPSDFGLRSDPPTHPELLDWLASEFIGTAEPRQVGTKTGRTRDKAVGVRQNPDGSGRRRAEKEDAPAGDGVTSDSGGADSPRDFSIKRMHRLIVGSHVYQQVSREPAQPIDPDNRLWNRTNRRRLDFESTRDSLIFVTGQLQDQIGGPSRNLLDGFQPRRTVYSFLNRLDLPGILSVFDFPNPAATSAGRDTTTVSPQALYLMNGPLIGPVADAVHSRLDVATISEPVARVNQLYRILFQRLPNAAEGQFADEFLGTQPSPAAWSQFIQALLVTNEFVFID